MTKISFVWQGISEEKVRNRWNDGLYAAMKLLEKEYDVEYVEPWDEITGDVVLYWEAPCTINGENSEHYKRIANLDKPKALLFAGGPIQKEWVETFDMVFTESQINDDEFEAMGISHMRAFGVNTDIFKPQKLEKKYDAIFHATFAGWKRHELFAKTFGDRGLAVGRVQAHDRDGYNMCLARGVKIIEDAPRDTLNLLLNQSKVCVNTSSYWGGGQRTTLEAMACDIPVVVMSDSPKNAEYVSESLAGVICEPEQEKIRLAWEEALKRKGGHKYVMSKWTPKHYADNLKKGICLIRSK